jgi:hypothetical protein
MGGRKGLGVILYMVERGNAHVITYAMNESVARYNAHNSWLGDHNSPTQAKDLQNYKVTALTEPGDRIHFDITLSA